MVGSGTDGQAVLAEKFLQKVKIFDCRRLRDTKLVSQIRNAEGLIAGNLVQEFQLAFLLI